jgi:hypothetical protein
MTVYMKTQQIKSPSGKSMKSQAQSTQVNRNSATRVDMSESLSKDYRLFIRRLLFMHLYIMPLVLGEDTRTYSVRFFGIGFEV